MVGITDLYRVHPTGPVAMLSQQQHYQERYSSGVFDVTPWELNSAQFVYELEDHSLSSPLGTLYYKADFDTSAESIPLNALLDSLAIHFMGADSAREVRSSPSSYRNLPFWSLVCFGLLNHSPFPVSMIPILMADFVNVSKDGADLEYSNEYANAETMPIVDAYDVLRNLVTTAHYEKSTFIYTQ